MTHTSTEQPEALRQRTSSMNERYTLADGYMEFAPDEGEWVRWSDYSKMRAEYQGEVHALKPQLEAAQAQRAPLTYTQINSILHSVPEDDDDA